MKYTPYAVAVLIVLALPAQAYCEYPIRTFHKTQIQVTDGFWSSWLNRNHQVTLPHILKIPQGPGLLQNFRRAAGTEEGPFVKGTANRSDDVKVFKFLEGLAYSGQIFQDPNALKRLDALWDTVLAAQQPDGYLCTRFILGEKNKKRKRLRPNPLAPWELRMGTYRVFYEIRDNSVVRVLAVGHKEHNDLYIRGRKVEL